MRSDPEGDSPAELHVEGSVRSRLQQLETVIECCESRLAFAATRKESAICNVMEWW